MAQKNGIAIRARKSGDACVRLMTRWLPLTFTPEMDEALPSMTAWAPTMSARNGDDGDCIFGLASRLNAYAKFAGPTAAPLENFVNDALTVKSYVFPLFETLGNPAAA